VAADEKHDLPAAWYMALRFCPYCSGTGKRERPPEDECGFCGATGDLFGHMLEEVYAMGRDEGVRALRALYADLVLAGGSTARHTVPAAQLKARLGL
jgi:hypothetical protein